MASLASPEILFAIATGLLPSVIWLFFWLHIDRDHPEPWRLLFLSFLMGAVAVVFASKLQNITQDLVRNPTERIALWAGIEEALKLVAFYVIAYKSDYDDEAIDPALYLITVALGFAALENVFYIIAPGASFNITAGLLTGGLRFFGSTLLHAIASCFIGICIGLSAKQWRGTSMLIGLAGATFLHTAFNFFILKNDTASALQIYGYLWVAAIISHVILEKLRRIPSTGSIA